MGVLNNWRRQERLDATTKDDELFFAQQKQKQNPSIRSKPRKLIQRDPETGMFTIKRSKKTKVEQNTGLWSKLKDGLYGGVDAVSGVGKVVGRLVKDDRGEEIRLGYDDDGVTKMSPGEKVMQKYAAEQEEEKKRGLFGFMSGPTEEDDSSSTTSRFDEIVVEEPKVEKKDAFTKAKDGFYSAYDFIFSQADDPKSKPSNIDPKSFRPLSRPLQNAYQKAKIAPPSYPPPSSAFEKTKDGIYNIIDTTQSIPQTITKTTSTITKTASLTRNFLFRTVPRFILSTYDTITNIPSSASTTAKSISKTANETILTLRSIPSTVESEIDSVKQKVNDVKQKVTSAKNAVRETSSNVKDAVYDAKVLAGLESPRPKPPPPPPPPKELGELGWELAGLVGKGVGKGVWWVGKGVVSVGVRSIVELVTGQKTGQKTDQKTDQKNQSLFANVKSGQEAMNVVTTVEEVDADLAYEIADALRLAEEAIAQKQDVEQEDATTPMETAAVSSDSTTTTTTSTSTNVRSVLEINNVLKRAKDAAIKAKKNADDLEELIRSRK